MSKQESYHPDGSEIVGIKSPIKREKGEWELWKRRMKRHDRRRIWSFKPRKWRWGKRSGFWHVGSYQTKEQAEVMHQKCLREAAGTTYTYYIVAPGDPRPNEK